MTTQYTKNFRLNLPDFRMAPWHDLVNQDFIKIDELLLGIAQGTDTTVWANNTSYDAGETAIDTTDYSYWVCRVTHTSAATGTFATDRLAHPSYWTRVVVGINPRGDWTNSTHYLVNDLVSDTINGVIAICKQEHISSAVPATIRTDEAYWTFIADIENAVGPPGPKGDKGDKGDQGDQGIQGIQGDKGDKGDQGIQGIQGVPGIQGIQGIQGEVGPEGGQGPQGVKGDKGDTGDQGPAGSGSGNVNGPVSAVNDNIAVFNGVTGTLLKDGGKKISELATIVYVDSKPVADVNKAYVDAQDALKVSKSGDTMTGQLNGTTFYATATLVAGGDVYAGFATTNQGVYRFGTDGNKYLQCDGSNFRLTTTTGGAFVFDGSDMYLGTGGPGGRLRFGSTGAANLYYDGANYTISGGNFSLIGAGGNLSIASADTRASGATITMAANMGGLGTPGFAFDAAFTKTLTFGAGPTYAFAGGHLYVGGNFNQFTSGNVFTGYGNAKIGSLYFGYDSAQYLGFDGTSFNLIGGGLLAPYVISAGTVRGNAFMTTQGTNIGTYYFGSSSTTSLSFDGTNYSMVGGPLLMRNSPSQYNPGVSARNVGAGGTGFEFGHTSTAGYASTIGAQGSSGNPYIAFNCGPGTTVDTYKTLGIKGAVIRASMTGGFEFGTMQNANADNQAFVRTAYIDGAGGWTGQDVFCRNITMSNPNGIPIHIINNAANGDDQRTQYCNMSAIRHQIISTAGSYIIYNGAASAGVQLVGQAATSWSAVSDARLKENVKTLNVLDMLEGFRAVRYTLKTTGLTELGIIAQEQIDQFPELIKQGSDGELVAGKTAEENIQIAEDTWSAVYDRFGVIALQGVKELLARVKYLEEKIAMLEAQPK